MDIGPPELLLILAVVLVLFGGSKIPALARNFGKAQAEFKRGLADESTSEPDQPAEQESPAIASQSGPDLLQSDASEPD